MAKRSRITSWAAALAVAVLTFPVAGDDWQPPPENADATCSETSAYTQTVNVSGPGTYSTTNTTFIASTQGTWRWKVSYSGDATNAGSTSACGVEQFTIDNDSTN